MEFIALGVLGAIGYVTNQQQNSTTKRIQESSQQPTTTNIELEKEFRNNVSKHLTENPNVVSNLSSGFVPFFRSEKSQNTNDALKDRRLETFTGVNNTDYTSKREVVSIPPVKELTHINGVTFQPDIDRYKGYVANNRQHNVSPIEKQYVGPGLGIPTDQPSAGGFHQRFRIMPNNVNEYRKNTFGAEIIPGKSHINNRTSDTFKQSTNVNHNQLTDQEQAILGNRPLDASHGYVDAQSIRADSTVHLSNSMNRGSANDWNGGLFGGSYGHYQSSESTRVSEHVLPQCIAGQPYHASNGAYQNNKYLVPSDTDRETTNCHRLNVAGNQRISLYNNNNSYNTNSQRGQTTTCPDQQFGGASSTTNASYSKHGWNASPTQKESIALTCGQRTGVVGSGISQGGYVSLQKDALRTTMRGQTQSNCGGGPAGSYVSGMDYTSAYNGTQQHMSRELAVVKDHIPNIQKPINIMLGTDQLKHGVTQQKVDVNPNRITSNAYALGTRNITDKAQLGSMMYGTDGVENTRDFGFVPENPLRTNILRKPTESYS